MVQAVSADFLPRMTGFDLRAIHVGFVVNKMALGQVLLRELRVPLPV